MLDSFLILFTYLSILCYLKFYHTRDRCVCVCACVCVCVQLFRAFTCMFALWSMVGSGCVGVSSDSKHLHVAAQVENSAYFDRVTAFKVLYR